MPTKIQWCDETLNVVTGCTKISAGCKHCYAEGIIKRFGHRGKGMEDPDKDFSHVVVHPERLDVPHKWKKSRFVFVCSMGDLFHLEVPFDFIDRVFDLMDDTYFHTYLVLTKRPERMKQYIEFDVNQNEYMPLENLWLGVSISTQDDADKLIPILLQTPAAKHFVSVEPMLEKIDLTTWLGISEGDAGRFARDTGSDLDWVICGCESGPKRRPAKIDWFRSLRDQCTTAKVPFFLKQAGGNPYINGKPTVIEMPALDGKVWDQKP